MPRPFRNDYSDRHRPKNPNPPIVFSSSVCDICKKVRGGHNDHSSCSKIRQKQRQERDAKYTISEGKQA